MHITPRRIGRRSCALAVLIGTTTALLAFAGCTTKEIADNNETIISSEAEARLFPLARPAMTAPTTVPAPAFIELSDQKSTLVYTCKQSQPAELASAIEGLISPEGSVQATPGLNVIVVTDKPDVIKGISNVLDTLDRKVPQLLVEARIVEVTVNDDLETEIRHRLSAPESSDNFFQSSNATLNTPGSTPTQGQGSNINVRLFSPGDFTFDTFVRLLLTRGKAKILSSPNLLVSSGSEASIITGQEVPVQSATAVGSTSQVTTQFKRVGIKLRVGLLQITNDTARIELNPEVSTVTGFVNSGSTSSGNDTQVISNPIIAIRNVTSTLSLKDGEILTVGGLLSTQDRETVRGVPLLMDIPGIGNLFKATRKQRDRTQLIFFLRAHILADGIADGIRVHNPDASMKVLDELPRDAVPTTRPATLEPAPGDRPLEEK